MIAIRRHEENQMQKKAHLLLPSNEVWGKVMFLLVSVILSTSGQRGGGSLYDVTSCLAASVSDPMFH